MPTLFCLKKTGPGESNLIASTRIKKIGKNTTSLNLTENAINNVHEETNNIANLDSSAVSSEELKMIVDEIEQEEEDESQGTFFEYQQ